MPDQNNPSFRNSSAAENISEGKPSESSDAM